MSETSRYRLDDLRRFATALGVGIGVAPVRASTLATQLLWFDEAGAGRFGVATLPTWLERIESGQIDPAAEGKVKTEKIGVAVFDGQNGIAPLVLARAGELAIEKARDAGSGLVRVNHVGPTGPASAFTAAMAIGPYVGFALGPGPEWSLAYPTEQGLPVVFDSALDEKGVVDTARSLDSLAPWASTLAPDGGWLIGAFAVAAFEPLLTFHERVGEAVGTLSPADWEERRRRAREHGVKVAPLEKLREWADRLKVDFPPPINSKKKGGR